jgi:hypothetical protein
MNVPCQPRIVERSFYDRELLACESRATVTLKQNSNGGMNALPSSCAWPSGMA